MKTRIRKRRVVFAAWALSLLVFTFAVGTFLSPFGRSVEFSQVYFVQGIGYFSSYPFAPETQYGWLYLADETVMPATWDEWRTELVKGFEFEPRYWQVPILTPSAAALFLASIMFWRPLRIDPGHCLNCDYNLTGIVGKCPECGTATESAPC